jgi:glycosyltransferase involved in cell wall biosynthesis
VVPSLNHGEFLEQNLRSIFEQEYSGNVEVAVVDGGSTDNSKQIIEKYSSKLTYWRSYSDSGQSSSLVEGFNSLRGEVSCYLNSDDALLPDALEKVSKFFSQNPQISFVYSNRVVIDEDSKVCDYWKLPRYRKWKIRQSDLIPQETLFWRTSVMESVGSFDPLLNFAMDYDFIYRLMNHGKGARINTFLAAFRYHSQSKTFNLLNSVGTYEISLLRKRYHVRLIPIMEKTFSLGVKIRTRLWLSGTEFFGLLIPKGSLQEIWRWERTD